MTTDKNTATTARRALAAHQKHVAALVAQAETLLRRVASFRAEVDAAHPAITNLDALRAQRREVLAEIALGESDATVLDLADQEIADAEAQARIAARGVEVASAGAGRLGREHAELVGQITAATKLTAALSYHAGVEIAQGRLAAYHGALQEMGHTYSDLLASCIAAEHFSDTTAVPPRMFLTGEMRATAFSSPLPALPGFDRALFDFDFSKQVEAATADALREIEG